MNKGDQPVRAEKVVRFEYNKIGDVHWPPHLAACDYGRGIGAYRGLRDGAGGRRVRALGSLGAEMRATKLTKREMEVAKLVAIGFNSREVAAQLGISTTTVSAHLRNIHRTLCISNGVQLCLWMVRHGHVLVLEESI